VQKISCVHLASQTRARRHLQIHMDYHICGSGFTSGSAKIWAHISGRIRSPDPDLNSDHDQLRIYFLYCKGGPQTWYKDRSYFFRSTDSYLQQCDNSTEATSLDWKISVFGKSQCSPVALRWEIEDILSLKCWENKCWSYLRNIKTAINYFLQTFCI
jgi:hypothetical protein